MTQATFDHLLRLIHVLKQHAVERGNWALWEEADRLYFRLLRT